MINSQFALCIIVIGAGLFIGGLLLPNDTLSLLPCSLGGLMFAFGLAGMVDN